MPKYEITLNQKSNGILFSTKYYISSLSVEAMQSDFDTLLTAQASIQTVDVEYLNAIAKNLDVVPNTYINLLMAVNQGGNTGQTAPVANFLNLVLSSASGRRTSKRIRGFVVNDLTSDVVFSIRHSGDTDQPNPDSGGIGTAPASDGYGDLLVSYLNILVSKFASPDFTGLVGFSTRASVGNKQVKRTY